jgi:hypothetical protein
MSYVVVKHLHGIFGYTPEVGITGSYGDSKFNLSGNVRFFAQREYTVFTFSSAVYNGSVSTILACTDNYLL